MHFIAGYGSEHFTKKHHRDITENISLSWEGTMTDDQTRQALTAFADVLRRASDELAQS